MRWSKIVSRLEDLFHPVFKGRLKVHLTTYSHSGAALGRGWVTIDGEEIYSVSGSTPESGVEFGGRQSFFEVVSNYPDRPLEIHLASSDPLVRLLTLADRRVGKGRLAELESLLKSDAERRIYLLRGIKRDRVEL